MFVAKQESKQWHEKRPLNSTLFFASNYIAINERGHTWDGIHIGKHGESPKTNSENRQKIIRSPYLLCSHRISVASNMHAEYKREV